MLFKVIEISDDVHDDFVMNHPNGDLLQLNGWAKSKALTNWYQRRIAVSKDDELAGVGSLLFKKLPKMKYTLCYVSRGFVCDYNDQALVQALLDAAIAVAKEEHSYAIKIDPDLEYEGNEDVVERLKTIGFKHSGLVDGMSKDNIQPRQTMVTDIDKSDQDLLKSFEGQQRTNVRKSMKSGIEFVKGTREDLPMFKILMDETGKRNGFLTRDITYFEAIYDALNPSGNMELFFTKLEACAVRDNIGEQLKEADNDLERLKKIENQEKVKGQIANVEQRMDKLKGQLNVANKIEEDYPNGLYLSGALLALSGHKSYYLYGASTDEHRNFKPNEKMQYQMMKFARDNGAKTYDFGGVSVDPDEDSEYIGLWRFKKVWGTKVSDKIGEFDYVLNKPIYLVAEKGVPFMQKLKVGLNKKLNDRQKSKRQNNG